jgi:hypothetical protein
LNATAAGGAFNTFLVVSSPVMAPTLSLLKKFKSRNPKSCPQRIHIMGEWTGREMKDCVAAGRLFRIDKLMPPNKVLATRIRRVKDELCFAEKNQRITVGSFEWPEGKVAEVGDFLFIDNTKFADLLKPNETFKLLNEKKK